MHVALAATPAARLRGLLGRAELPDGEALVIVPASSVHCLGMAFPIDVLHLARDGMVLKVVPDLKPWRLGPLVWRSHSVVELPAGTAAATETQPGDRVELEPLVG